MPAILMFLSTIAGPLVAKVLAGLGIGAIAYVGIDLMLSEVGQYIRQSFSSMPSEVLDILGLMKADIAINLVLSAIATRAMIAGFTGGRSKLGPVTKA